MGVSVVAAVVLVCPGLAGADGGASAVSSVSRRFLESGGPPGAVVEAAAAAALLLDANWARSRRIVFS